MPGVSPAVSNKPPAIQHSVVALHAQGLSKRKIAKQIGISINTVLKILNVRQPETEAYQNATISRIIPKAFQVIENAIDTGDAQLAMRYLERTALAESQGETYHFAGDASLTQVVQLMPSAPSLPSTTSSPESTGTITASDRSSREGPPDHLELSIHPNFSTFSTDQIRAELARREAAPTVLDAEVVDAP